MNYFIIQQASGRRPGTFGRRFRRRESLVGATAIGKLSRGRRTLPITRWPDQSHGVLLQRKHIRESRGVGQIRFARWYERAFGSVNNDANGFAPFFFFFFLNQCRCGCETTKRKTLVVYKVDLSRKYYACP